ncbi:DNA damage-inducible protein D [Candidatus Gracilibacteria bacterium]|nr:DNA damage-inducible protein D [Candidatus Gracilibacteria bacterium]
MKEDIIYTLTGNFESCGHETEDGVEFWFARDLQHLLGYSKWENFSNVISKAKTACEISGYDSGDHFPTIRKMVSIGSGAEKEIDDIMLTRYACYLIAQNGDSSKEAIAFAQTYFAMQTRKAEIIAKRIGEIERIQARKKLSESEKELSSVIYEQTGGNQNFALIRSKGDSAFFGGKNTASMKITWQTGNKPIADFMPTILLKAKDFATEITIHNAKDKRMKTEKQISDEHVTNNTSVRNTLISRGIVPEKLNPAEDIKKVERKVETEKKKHLKNISQI